MHVDDNHRFLTTSLQCYVSGYIDSTSIRYVTAVGSSWKNCVWQTIQSDYQSDFLFCRTQDLRQPHDD